jgi:hypothetical protein
MVKGIAFKGKPGGKLCLSSQKFITGDGTGSFKHGKLTLVPNAAMELGRSNPIDRNRCLP